MEARIKRIQPDSIAEELGLVPGDVITAINGNRDCQDLFDYELLTSAEWVELEVKHVTDDPENQLEIIEIEKDPWDELGIEFESPLFTPIRTCNNACPFCFIDQQPAGLRPSLYVKDDDYRLSYFFNTYITLTNLTPRDRERIEQFKPGPLYVSVHSTVPEVREILLKNKKAGTIMQELEWLASLDIPFHCQVVVCPGINDQESLTQTLNDLATLRPQCQSVAVVPVGLTQWREQLPELQPVTENIAQSVIDRIDAFKEQTQIDQWVYPSDEFYIRAKAHMPKYDSYGDFPQLDDGVGSARLLVQEFFELESTLPATVEPARNEMIITGELGQLCLQPIVQRLNQIPGLYIDCVAVKNEFWGDAVTVTGLITGQDIKNTLASMDLSGYHRLLIPETMLKSGQPIFLDGVSVADLEAQFDCTIQVVADATRAQSLLDVLFDCDVESECSVSVLTH